MKPKSIVTDLVQSLYHALNVELSDKILETRDLKEFQKLSKEEQQIIHEYLDQNKDVYADLIEKTLGKKLELSS